MCARCFSSRRTSPFSAMICSILSTVVYCAGLRAQMASCTSRTVVGPRLHSTVRISSSASVGLGNFSAIYEDVTTKTFVCQEGKDRPGGLSHILLFDFAEFFAGAQQGRRFFSGRGIVLGLFVGRLGRILLLGRVPL